MSAPSAPALSAPRAPLTKKALTADHPTWCPGCGDFAVLASFYKVLEKLNYPQEKIVTFAGFGCSSRFPYFVNSHGGHFIHGRALPFAAGISLGNDDLHVFVFGGDGDGFSIGGNHLVHTARKNPRPPRAPSRSHQDARKYKNSLTKAQRHEEEKKKRRNEEKE